MDNLFAKFQPLEQSRWNQANIDTLFYAGNQSFINQQFSFSPGITSSQYYFNLVQQPINLVTGYQRQHRKSILYQASDGSDPHTTDQYTRLIKEAVRQTNINEMYSKSCELAAIAGMNLMQPYLDYTEDDPAQGTLKVKVWEYNSFIVDPFFRQPDMSDCRFVWCQEFIDRLEAESRFGDKVQGITPMGGNPQRTTNFYFLPENYNLGRNDLYVLSYIWYRWKKKRKRLYSKSRQQFFDYSHQADLEAILYNIPDLVPVEVDSPCWKCAVVLNDMLMFLGDNPLWDGPECPFVVNYWNYDPHINQPDLRSRSLIFPLRSPQFLFNYKVITNNDIAAATINAGWKRKSGAVANEDNLKRAGQGWDVIINEGYEMTDVEKIIPSAVPESDLALAQQMADLIQNVSGINLENWSAQEDRQASTLTVLIKQAANLMVFQKYFDQWDMALKLLGERLLLIAMNNWNEYKVQMMLNEEPSEYFYSKIFAKYKTMVLEGLDTPTQQNLAAQQKMDINTAFGREVFPPSMIIKDLNIQDKAACLQFLEQQEQQAAAAQQEAQTIDHAFNDAKLKELTSKAVANISMAKERVGRYDANVGLLEERLSEISKNQSLSTKAKMEALEKLVQVVGQFGEIETQLKMNEIESINAFEDLREDEERAKAGITSEGNKFLQEILGNVMQNNTPSTMQQNQILV